MMRRGRYPDEVKVLLALSKLSPQWVSARDVSKAAASKTVYVRTASETFRLANCVEERTSNRRGSIKEYRIVKYGPEVAECES